ncbi:unnamed protein product [Calypogeia fissa]
MVPAVGGNGSVLSSMPEQQQQQQQTAAELLSNSVQLVQCLNGISVAAALQLQMAQTMRSGQEEPHFLRDSSTGEAASDMKQVLKPSAVAPVPGTALSTTMGMKAELNGAFALSEVNQSSEQVAATDDATSEQVSGYAKEIIVPTAQCMLLAGKVTERDDDDEDDDDDDDDEDYEEGDDDDDDKLEARDDDQDAEGDEEEVDEDVGEDEGETEENGGGEDEDGEEGDEDEMDGEEDGDEEEPGDEEDEDGEEEDDEAEEESEEEVSEAEPPKKKRK